MKRRKLEDDKKNIFKNRKAWIIIAFVSLVIVTIAAVYAGKKSNKPEKPNVKIVETNKESIKETQEETLVSKAVEKEIEEEIKKIEDKGLSKEGQEKEIKKAKEKIVEKVAKENKVNKGNINNIVERNVSKRVESSTKINKEVKEKARETRKEAEKKIEETIRETKKEKETKQPQPSKPKETKKEAVRTTETQLISFNTIDNYASTGGKSRVYQEGRNGERTIVKEDGKIVSNKVTRNPQDKIIERYVKVQDKKVETREVEDKSKPVYRTLTKDRWFVHNDLTGETKYFYSAGEAEDYMTNNRILGNWGTADPETTKGPLIGYDTKKEEVVVQEEKWEWKR